MDFGGELYPVSSLELRIDGFVQTKSAQSSHDFTWFLKLGPASLERLSTSRKRCFSYTEFLRLGCKDVEWFKNRYRRERAGIDCYDSEG